MARGEEFSRMWGENVEGRKDVGRSEDLIEEVFSELLHNIVSYYVQLGGRCRINHQD